MSKEAEILRKWVSCDDEHMCQKSRKSRGSCISGVSVLQKVTLNGHQAFQSEPIRSTHFSFETTLFIIVIITYK